MKKKLIIAAGIGVTLVLILCILASNPIVSCKVEVPENYIEAVKSQAKGVYSDVLPLVPVCVSVDSYLADKVYYTILYFPFGKLAMSYTEADGYNIEKPLTGL